MASGSVTGAAPAAVPTATASSPGAAPATRPTANASPLPAPLAGEQPQRTGRAIVVFERTGSTGGRDASARFGPHKGPNPAFDGRTELRRRLTPALAGAEAELRGVIPALGVAALRPAPGTGVAELRRELGSDPAVRAVEPEYRRSPRLVPTDPLYTQNDPRAPRDDLYQWHLRDQGFEGAWELSRGGGAKVAIIDSGIDGRNPDFRGRIARAVERMPGPSRPRRDEDGHGTHVAGLACAHSNNDYGGASAGFACRLIVEKTEFRDFAIAASIRDAAKHGADVINMSFGGPQRSRAIRRAIRFAWRREVVMVTSASNANTTDQGFPARYLQPPGSAPKLGRGKGLVVTAAEYGGGRSHTRPGHGSGVSMAAIGAADSSHKGILSNFPANTTIAELGTTRLPPCECRARIDGDDRYAYIRGTSEAAPQVAGAAALIRAAHPGIEARRVITILKRTAGGERFRGRLGWGVLDAERALEAAAR